MKCLACGVELNPSAAFCHVCGAKVADPLSGNPAASDPTPPLVKSVAEGKTVEDSGRGGGLGGYGGSRKDDPEVELWQGGYSGKAMLNSYAGAALLSIAALVLGLFFPGIGLLIAVGVIVVVWLLVFAVLLYRRMNISYRLTSQRFFHQTGILTRTTNRIEVIEMDDVTFSQSLLERLVGVGTIKITSSDRTDPELIMVGIANVQEVSEIIDKARRKELTRRGLRIESV